MPTSTTKGGTTKPFRSGTCAICQGTRTRHGDHDRMDSRCTLFNVPAEVRGGMLKRFSKKRGHSISAPDMLYIIWKSRDRDPSHRTGGGYGKVGLQAVPLTWPGGR